MADHLEDHPRSRGVYLVRAETGAEFFGSSPLARGLLQHSPGLGATLRIIPARAGFTGGPRPRTGQREDHPRSRGVYLEEAGHTTGIGGSSPLARGLR